MVPLALSGCGYYPPSVNSSRDAVRLSQAHVSLRVRRLADEDIPALQHRAHLQMLFFSDGHAIEEAKITDRGLLVLSKLHLPELHLLDLGYCQTITDRGLIHVSRMKTVKRLSLRASQGISDSGIHHLRKMTGLRQLDLRGCGGISNKCLADLRTMKNLQEIQLGGCENITMAAVRELQAQMPGTKVEKDETEWSYHLPQDSEP
ncbi:MAG: hypothetical protein V4733_11685 [Verrucomicrobiota bacterium]